MSCHVRRCACTPALSHDIPHLRMHCVLSGNLLAGRSSECSSLSECCPATIMRSGSHRTWCNVPHNRSQHLFIMFNPAQTHLNTLSSLILPSLHFQRVHGMHVARLPEGPQHFWSIWRKYLVCDDHRQLVLFSVPLQQICHPEKPRRALSIAPCKDGPLFCLLRPLQDYPSTPCAQV